mgnify:CR=1 FL=1
MDQKNFVTCEHSEKRGDWLRMQNGIMKPHPYCSKCGIVKNVSSDRGKKFSYFVVSLSKLRKILKNKGYKVSEIQIRLIINELKKHDGFEDIWWITFSKQKEIFIETVGKYIRISKDLIASCL